MLGLTGLHELASSRSDGLRPELLELFAARQRFAAANVATIGARFEQAGPNPVRGIDGELPAGILRFPLQRAAAGMPKAEIEDSQCISR